MSIHPTSFGRTALIFPLGAVHCTQRSKVCSSPTTYSMTLRLVASRRPLTREDFTSEEEFLRWKNWSDDDYYTTENDKRGYYDNCLALNEALNLSVSAYGFYLLSHFEKHRASPVISGD